MATKRQDAMAKINQLISSYRGGSGQSQSTTGQTNPTLSAQEVQQAVGAHEMDGSNAATQMPAVTGIGQNGRGGFYGAIGAGGGVTNRDAFLAAAPGAYNSPYRGAMEATLNQLLNPTPFKYDVNADGLYQQIKDNYIKQGRQAMMDTQGQSAALTGGYGNSYGAMAGQQAYQESLGNLAGMIPELQQLAWQQYQQEQDDKRNNLEAMNKLEAQEYARWADEQAAYQELLKAMPAVAAGGGGYRGPSIVTVPAGGTGAKSNGNVLDPTTWAQTLSAFSDGTLKPEYVYQVLDNGGSFKGMDSGTMKEAALYSLFGGDYNPNLTSYKDPGTLMHQSLSSQNQSVKSGKMGNSTGNTAADRNKKSKALND